MPSQQNIDQLSALSELLEKSKAVVLTDYAGLSAKLQVELRQNVVDAGGQFLVAKNRIFKLAVKKSGASLSPELEKELKGTTAFLFAFEDEIAPIKALIQFSEQNELPKTKIGLILKPSDRVLTIEEVEELAKLPTLDELRARLIGSLNAPRVRFVNALSGNFTKLVNTLKEIKNKKQSN